MLLLPTGVKLLASRQSRLRESSGTQDYAAMVAAMSKTVAALSQEIAAEIKSVVRSNQATSKRAVLEGTLR